MDSIKIYFKPGTNLQSINKELLLADLGCSIIRGGGSGSKGIYWFALKIPGHEPDKQEVLSKHNYIDRIE